MNKEHMKSVQFLLCVDAGLIVFQDLTEHSVVFPHLIEQYGIMELEEELDEAPLAGKRSRKTKGFADESAEDGVSASKRALQMEERNTGSVTWEVYRKYLTFAGPLYCC